jgi:hypothetical protein
VRCTVVHTPYRELIASREAQRQTIQEVAPYISHAAIAISELPAVNSK